MKPQKHCELIKFWADGGEIEMQLILSGDWVFCAQPCWDTHGPFRKRVAIKKKYRVGRKLTLSNGEPDLTIVRDDDSASRIESLDNFVEWLDDWVEYES